MSKTPNEPLSVIYADAKEHFANQTREMMKDYPLPFFMWEGIVENYLVNLKSEVALELSAELQSYKKALESYYDKKMEEEKGGEKEDPPEQEGS